jgi:hypothetical protein
VPTPHNDACTPDGNPCTDTVCTIGVGCQNVNDNSNTCDDGIACTTNACVDGTCTATPHNENCTPDTNPCTDTVCTVGVGCQNVNDNSNTCSDGVNCTRDACVAGSCVGTPDDTRCTDDQEICTVERCSPTATNRDADGCTHTFTPGADPSCSTGVCRTAGFWGTHGGSEKKGINTTQRVIDSVGCLEVCGERISNTTVNSDDSAIEALCVSPQGTQLLQLMRQLTATALNCIVTNGTTNCANINIADLSLQDVFGACNDACASGKTSADIDPGAGTTTVNCIQILDCFNNGGIYDIATGFCTIGTCSGSGIPCSPTTNCGAGSTCVRTPGNCEDQALTGGCDGCTTFAQGNASSSTNCNLATGNNCTVVDGVTLASQCSKKTFGEVCCTADQFPEANEPCPAGSEVCISTQSAPTCSQQ